MTTHSLRRAAVTAVVASALLVPLLPAGPAAAEAPTIRLIRSSREVTLSRSEGHVSLDLGVFVAAQGGDFRIHARKAQWSSGIAAAQYDREGNRIQGVPRELLAGWRGLRDFATVTFRDTNGAVAASTSLTFCPNGWERQRLSDESVTQPSYPSHACDGASFPFTKGMVWGIDAGWATAITSPYGEDPSAGVIDVPPGRYTVVVEIARPHADVFAVGSGRRVTVTAVVEEVEHPEYPGEEPWETATPTPAQAETRTLSSAPAHLLPDLAALPAWALDTVTEDGRDLLTFASTPWNAGPGPFVVEGFRRRNADVMDAYQYFYDAQGKVQGRAPIGSMEYHQGGGHDHWHFLQFAAFDILDRSGTQVVQSHKQGFCIAPTHPIDLTLPGAVMEPWSSAGGSSCGGPKSLWVREVLAAGWGDTYHNVFGQAFDITDLPNGTYQVRVRVDPDKVLQQRTTENDVAVRKITLAGEPGARTVAVARWNGIAG